MDRNVDAEIVIVGAGICGLATALALHRFSLFISFLHHFHFPIQFAIHYHSPLQQFLLSFAISIPESK